MSRRSPGEVLLELHLRELGQPFVSEYRFHPTRMWRFDFAYPHLMLAVEIEGGTWSGGRHVRGAGFERDLEKLNSAALLSWTVYRFTTHQVETGVAQRTIAQALDLSGQVAPIGAEAGLTFEQLDEALTPPADPEQHSLFEETEP